MTPVTSFLVLVCIAVGLAVWNFVDLSALVFLAAARPIAPSLTMADVWQTFVILRLGQRLCPRTS
jgi:hypothetical protein